MKAMRMEVEPFPGWPAVWAALASMDPRLLVFSAVRAAWVSAKAGNGVFVGDPILHFKNHAILTRLALRAELDGLGSSGEYDKERTKALLRQLSQRGEELLQRYYDAVPGENEAHRQERIAIGSWLMALTYRGRNRSAKFELARAWILLRKKWIEKRDTIKEMYEGGLQLPLSTAFDSMEGWLFLAVMMMQADGIVPDPVRALGETRLGTSAQGLLDLYSVELEDLIPARAVLEQYPDVGLENPFLADPFVRLPDGVLLAPDPGAALTCIEERLVLRALRPFVEESEHREELARTMLGYVFESYVADVLGEIARPGLTCRVVPEFEYRAGDQILRSPDGFLVDGNFVAAFEAKVTRFPHPLEAQLTMAAFLDWLAKISGRRANKPPLAQGSRFVGHWQGGNPDIVGRLGVWPGYDAFGYFIVSTEDPPFIVKSPEFRQRFWHPLLGADERVLDGRTAFISIKDLEALQCVASIHERGTLSFDATKSLRDWEAHLAGGPHAMVQSITAREIEFKMSLADFLVGKFGSASTEFPRYQREALHELFSTTGGQFFDNFPG